jgi:cyclic beta-1,2-glucan synthetase
LFGAERLEQYAATLAAEHEVSDVPKRGRPLLPRLEENARQLVAAYRTLAEAIRRESAISPAAEWFVDNFHIVEDQLREIREDLPVGFYRELPKLERGEMAGYPRVYALALAFIAHTDSHLDAEVLRRFVRTYQQSRPLTIGELWALAISLRLALVENLRRLASRVVAARAAREEADALADELLELAGRRPERLTTTLAGRLGEGVEPDRAFVVQLTQRLREQDPAVASVFDWLEEKLRERGQSVEEIVHLEHQRQASSQVTVGNIIGSMRLLSTLDWRDFFESVSLVDPVLGSDPAGVYARMDFATRDRYRHVVERIGKRTKRAETDVARAAVGLADRSRPGEARAEESTHVGYYLVGEGVSELERAFDYRPPARARVVAALLRHPAGFYLGALSLLTALFVALLVSGAYLAGAGWLTLAAFALLTLIPASDLAVGVLNWDVTHFFPPRVLPKLDASEGLPADARTMVVVPTILANESAVDELVANLEIHYLANRDEHIYFALLGDYADAEAEETATDAAVLERALAGIEQLNERHGGEGYARFHLFHRRRLWNEGEGKWMGWERKRGKLQEFNRLLRGARDTGYTTATADAELLAGVRYVITLDSDTRLPRDAARRLVGVALHPLNLPRYDREAGLVTRGYGILQPRISITLEGASRSRFARVFSGQAGLDPYTTAASDVYQDLFGEGSFTGKGLYHVDAFETALEGRIPDNSILSHDLFEGLHARCALVTDIELFDDAPAQYDSYARRGYRWVRGDWQIARWLFARAPGPDGRGLPNPLPLISRWKIFDNMRRSLVPPSLLVWLAAVWTFVPGSPAWWMLFVVVALAFPVYMNLGAGVLKRARGIPWSSRLRAAWGDARKNTAQSLVVLMGIAHQAYLNADAVARTLYRTLVARRRLLEWTTAAQAEQGRARNLAGMFRFMWPGVALALAVAALVAALRPSALVTAAPFLVAWACAPFVMHLLSRRAGAGPQVLSAADARDARLAARRTWRFFETFVTAEDNWLPPDNFQEDPKPVVAHRTSPTNVGLLLLATVSAHDLGYTGTLELVERLELTLDTLQRLPKFRGHLFNWYDTRTLEPLEPRYVSTVDSGNLAGHLLALKQACVEAPELPLFGAHTLAGLADTVALLRQESERAGAARKRTEVVTAGHLRDEVAACAGLVAVEPPDNLSGWETLLNSLHRHATAAEDMLAALGQEHGTDGLAELNFWTGALLRQLKELSRDLRHFAPSLYPDDAVTARLSRLARVAEELFEETDFKFLFDEEREVFRIGFNVGASKADNSFYDLLASEARLASFLAIAKGDVPQEHWFRLGRQLTPVDGGRALISWTASMFEYLMPLLVMRDYEGTLLHETYRAVVRRQIEYGAERRVPWGISEAAYNARDLHLNYQYGPFGVPGLGLKRGLSEDLVVAPYATMLAALVESQPAFENLRRLEREGALARYGFYESIDYTPDRLPQNQKRVLVRAFMAHHQGMSLVALDNLLNRDAMRRRFHSEPLVQATELLLQERVPFAAPAAHPRAEEVRSGRAAHAPKGVETRVYDTAELPTPRTQLLSAGTYSVMLTTAGSGFSTRGHLAVTRWREDATRDNYGSFLYLRDVRGGAVWSAGRQPVARKPQAYEVTLAEDKVDIRRSDGGILTHTEIIVTPEDDAELRRVSLTNNSARARDIEVTSYAEVVLAPHAADAAHPAFSNLFVETEFVTGVDALVARRRPRSSKDEPVFGVHVVVAEGETVGALQYETDRSRFLGRGHSTADPAAVFEERPLSNTVGAVLDPVFSLRRRVRLQPGETARLTFTTAVAQSREEALALAGKYHDTAIFERAAQLAWTQSQVEMRHHNIDAEEAHLFQRLAGRVLYADPSLRPRPHTLALNTKTQAGLWQYGISGDLPIVLARVGSEEDLDVARQLLRAHGYLRLKGLAIDLVILNDHPTSYIQTVQEELDALVRSSGAQGLQDKPGGVFMRRSDLMPDEDRILLHAVARVVIVAERGTLEEQLVRREPEPELPPALIPRAAVRAYTAAPPPATELAFFNGLGGFSEGGREYVITLGEGQWTPAPWANVVAGEHDFGFQVTETGAGYTWSANSRENRLTPWSNDAVSDPPGEVVYLRDEETGEVWTPTPLPVREPEAYVVRHGQGYTAFEHTSHGIAQELLLFVPPDAPVKISRLRLRNTTDRRRRLSVTNYNELTLGVSRGASASHVITEIDAESGAIFARNPYNNEFAGRVAFADVSLSERSATCDRKEFIGRHGNLARPAALGRTRLAGRDGAGLDPCAALQTSVELAPGEWREIFFLFGEGGSREEAESVLARFRSPRAVDEAFEQTLALWDGTLETLRVRTPDPSLDMLLNRWLLCQTLACRVWARSAFYQSGGAYGFRDQLQDVMAVVYARPDVARAQLLRAAAHQFKEGDVQHWWHPPTGRGVRTRFSDDLLWLPYVTAFYVGVTGDRGVLDETAPFVEAPPLEEGEDESYRQPSVSEETATLYEHCARALDRSLKTGAHGLPLMGSGDWNDGMNRVGNQGRGESVWVGWFLHTTLAQFAPLCEGRGDAERASAYLEHTGKLKQALEAEAWDGDWYRRAYFDDGTPLGSAQNEECRIDSIAQSWAVISGAGDPHRAHRAMAAVEEHLIHRGDGLVMLFAPPFDRGTLDPGYIKGYVPGVRENGGQYTHAALWVLIAYALAGDGDRAGELFALLNPINHASTRAGMHKYKVEPYVAAADVYAVHPHTGRGGWTWYTGSASWMYRAGLEFILGFRLRGASLRIEPCIPRGWREYEIDYRHGSSRYHIKVENPSGSGHGVRAVEVDGVLQASDEVALKDDGASHQVRIVLG